jgi:hypothetical protein
MGRIVRCCGTCARWMRDNGPCLNPDTAETSGLCNWILPEEIPFAFKVSAQLSHTSRDQGTECPCWTPKVEGQTGNWGVIRLYATRDIKKDKSNI